MSHTVAASMYTLADLKKLDEGAKDTADFIHKMNDLFDCFNSSSLISTVPLKSALRESDPDRIQYLQDTLKWLNSVKSKSGKDLPCLEGWKQNVRALLLLFEDFQRAGGKFLMTRRLNQDCLEHFFGVIRGKGGHRDNPDAHTFRMDYRQAVVDYLAIVGKNTNCEPEDTHILLRLTSLFPKVYISLCNTSHGKCL